MSIHDLARAASEDLRAHTTADVDAGLAALRVAHTRRQRHSRATAALVAAAAVAAAWWGGASLGHHDTTPRPAGPGNAACTSPLVTCLGHRTFRFALTVPVTWQIPRGYGVDSGAGATVNMVESYAHVGHPGSGVTVMEGVSAPSRNREAARAGGPTSAAGWVSWLAARPDLITSTPRPTTIDGRPGWQVRVALKPHAAPGSGRCTGSIGGIPCHPVTYQDVGTTTGVWKGMTADYTAFDLPGSGTAVVWSWAFGHDTRALARNQTVVGGLSWPTG